MMKKPPVDHGLTVESGSCVGKTKRLINRLKRNRIENGGNWLRKASMNLLEPFHNGL